MADSAKKTTTKKAATKAGAVPELTQMLEAGVHFGHERSKRNPRMESYIFLQRNRIAIVDLEKTHEALTKAVQFAEQVASKPNAEVLFVGTKRQARDIVARHAEEAGMPYVTKRWLGGTLTNFATVQKSIEKLAELKKVQESDAIKTMTKKEQSVMRKEISRLEEVLEGIKDMRALPAALFAVGSHDERLAVREARRVGIPVIGIADTNADPTLVDYPIPGNDDAVRSLDLLVGCVTAAIMAGKKKATAKAAA